MSAGLKSLTMRTPYRWVRVVRYVVGVSDDKTVTSQCWEEGGVDHEVIVGRLGVVMRGSRCTECGRGNQILARLHFVAEIL